MTAKKADLADLPAWPRLLTKEAAAAYCSMSPNSFTTYAKVKPIAGLGDCVRYDRLAIDAWIDSIGAGTQLTGKEWLDRLNGDDNADNRARN